MFFWTKTVQSRKHYKNRGFSGNCKKAKMTSFFWKNLFLTWLKNWVLLTVFLKSCVSWKHYFYSAFSKTQLFKNKNCMLKKTENLWEIVGCFWTWQNGVFGFEFWGFNIKKVGLWCVWHCFKSVKNACFFPVFWAFLGWLIVVHLGLEGLGVFVFLVFVFLCCVVFASVLFALLLVLWLFCLLFCLFFVFFVLFFLEGSRVRWGGPKGHLTWP